MKLTDELIRKLAIIAGITTGVLFFLSMISAIEYPAAFKYLALAMIIFAIAFLVLRSAFNYRNTFSVKDRRNPKKG